MALDACPDCGALFPPSSGPTHRYIGASAGCWALYAAIVANQEPDGDLLAHSRVPPTAPLQCADESRLELGQLLVDAYAVQHHGVPSSPQAIQSVAVHLLTLHGVIACGQPVGRALWIRRRALRRRGVFRSLAPPSEPALTIRHLFAGGGVTTPCAPADYVVSVYTTWQQLHGATIATWYDRDVVAD